MSSVSGSHQPQSAHQLEAPKRSSSVWIALGLLAPTMFLPASLLLLAYPLQAGVETAAGFFSEGQAERGRVVYEQTCKECHALSEFKGEDFEWTWRRRTAWNLYESISTTMPESDPGGLGKEKYVDVIAYLLSVNEYAVGSTDLEGTKEALSKVPLGEDVNKTKPEG